MSGGPDVLPRDEHNATLVANVHPPGWRNPTPADRYNLVVIGAGTAGLVSAAAGAILGARVALVERHLMGGDCLNVGCVPSKAVIRSSRVLGELAGAAGLGVRVPDGTEVDFGAVMARMRRVRARISEHDSARRFRDLGVDLFLGEGRFAGREAVEVDGARLRFRKAVIATGGRPGAPPIEGLAEAGFLTNESVFSLTERPPRLAVIGGGPIGCELAQAFRRLGSEVALLEVLPRILGTEDADAAAIVERQLRRDRVRIVTGAAVQRVRLTRGGKVVRLEAGGAPEDLTVDEILVAAGRLPNVEGLGLEAAGVAFDRTGVRVNERLQTTNPRIYAAGDVCLPQKFTHAAHEAARIVVQNALFLGRKKVSALTMPWCTYTDPEIAQVGLTDREAEARGIPVDTHVQRFDDADRAIVDGEEDGFVKVHLAKGSDRILGATIVARHAGEMINEITLAMTAGLGLGAIGRVVHPYPTQAEAIRQTADAYRRTRLTPLARRAMAAWFRWTR
jgi:pyruvate/2-oxoglutarate dehydrogenase complex dihydrolipoamide dehydrogenase (E3) component